MTVHISNALFWFCIAFSIMLFATILMGMQGKRFYTKDGSIRMFSIMELEFPARALEVCNIIKGIYALPVDQSQRSIKALRMQFLIDFILFMPATYGGIFILCMKVSEKTSAYGTVCFTILGWAQILAFVFDAIENIYLLNKINPGVTPSTAAVHSLYIKMEMAKWGIALIGAIGSFSALLYYWVSGFYDVHSIKYVAIFALEIFLFFPVATLMNGKSKKENEEENYSA